jgi:hypothetical protein
MYAGKRFQYGGKNMLVASNRAITRKLIIATIAVSAIVLLFGLVFTNANIIMILQNAGVKHIPKGIAEALTTIGGVYGVQQFIIAALGVTVPLWAAGAVAATGAAGV